MTLAQLIRGKAKRQHFTNELTDSQKLRVDKAVKKHGPLAISHIACSLGLTREYVQSYVKAEHNRDA